MMALLMRRIRLNFSISPAWVVMNVQPDSASQCLVWLQDVKQWLLTAQFEITQPEERATLLDSNLVHIHEHVEPSYGRIPGPPQNPESPSAEPPSWKCSKCGRFQMHEWPICRSEFDTGIPCNGVKPGHEHEWCDCEACAGMGLVDKDGSTCACIIAGCRKKHRRDFIIPSLLGRSMG